MWHALIFLLAAVEAATPPLEGAGEQVVLPRLFHLDHYERCLARREGLYCLGSFRIVSDSRSPAFSFIKEYSSKANNFDRGQLHRGYCLSSRCPSQDPNTTLRFERCVDKHALTGAPGLRASLLSYSCETRQDLAVRTDNIDEPQRIFVGVAAAILFLNVVGTLYDLVVGDGGKNKLVSAWSLRSNWARLTASYEDGDPRLAALAPLQGVRVLLLMLVMMTHASELQHKVYLYNPEFFEKALTHPMTMLIRNGSSLVQIFIVVSNFLFAYSLLLFSKNKNIGLKDLPMCILHRLIRITPVHLLVVGFAATWWRHTGSGPQWNATVGAESDICRKKFWAHAFYLHNFIDSDEHCLLPTWFLAVDMQLYVLAAALTLRRLRPRLRTLLGLVMLAILMNGLLAYYYEWKSLLHIMVPENVRHTFRGVSSFRWFYIAPWGSLPAALLGLLAAHAHHRLQEGGYKIAKHKWFIFLYQMIVPLFVALILGGHGVESWGSRSAVAAYVALERPAFALLTVLCILGSINNIDTWFRRVTSWRCWQMLGRMSLSVLMLHWVVNMRIVAAKHTLSEVSVTSIGSDLMTTAVHTHVLAVPLTLMVEYPAQRSFAALLGY